MSHDNPCLEIGHGPFIDIVGYSTWLTEEQKAAIGIKSSEVPRFGRGFQSTPFRRL